jgi:hypothetical protein
MSRDWQPSMGAGIYKPHSHLECYAVEVTSRTRTCPTRLPRSHTFSWEVRLIDSGILCCDKASGVGMGHTSARRGLSSPYLTVLTIWFLKGF